MGEEERIKLAYRRRHRDAEIYSLFNPGHLFITQQLEKELIRLLQPYQITPLSNKKVLDVGCGTGWLFKQLIRFGADPENMCGVDLLPEAIEEARKISTKIDIRQGNADTLPFGDESFDLVAQFIMFSSILDDVMRKDVAEEMLRVLKNNGIILWYDYFVSKPTNRDVKGVGRREIMRLFQNCVFNFRRVTLAPPIARAIAPYSFLLCCFLDKIPWLRTHYLVVIKKQDQAG